MKVNVLGTEYEIIKVEETNDNLEKYPLLRDNSGYTDITTKQIFILNYKATDDTFIQLDVLYKKTLRHELVHAYLYESGLFNNSNNDWAKNEEIVDWIALQFEKLLNSYIQVGAIEVILPIKDITIPKVKVATAFAKSSDELLKDINKAITSIPINIDSNIKATGGIIGGGG